jgi:hypothetical protein
MTCTFRSGSIGIAALLATALAAASSLAERVLSFVRRVLR